MKVNTETIIRLQHCTIHYTLYADGKIHIQCRERPSWRRIKQWCISLFGSKHQALVFETDIPTFETNRLRFMLCGKSFQELTAYRILQKDIVEFIDGNFGKIANKQITEALLRKINLIEKNNSENAYDWVEVFLLLMYEFNKLGVTPYELVEMSAHKLDIFRDSTGTIATLLACSSRAGGK